MSELSVMADTAHLPASAHALLAGIAAYQHVNPLPATVLNDAARSV
ncbi:MAG: hypothetical protein V9H69_17760 [Anaerolineae bacterium]